MAGFLFVRGLQRILWERGLPAIEATRSVRYTALSFIASKLSSHRESRYLQEPGLPAIEATRSVRYTA